MVPMEGSNCMEGITSLAKFLLTYLNPGQKKHKFLILLPIKSLVVYPQQARMFSSPTVEHLEALTWCERF